MNARTAAAVVIVCVFAWRPPAVFGETPDAELVTLENAVAIALTRHPVMARADARVSQAEAMRDGAIADFLPRLGAQGRLSRASDADRIEIARGAFGQSPLGPIPATALELEAGDRDNAAFRLSVTQPLFTGGALRGNYASADAGRRMAVYGREADRFDLIYQVERAYIGVLKSLSDVAIAKQEMEDIAAHLKKARDRYDAGMVPYNDVLKTEARLAHARQSYTTSANTLAAARGDLNLLLRRDIRAPLSVAEYEDFWTPPDSFEDAVRKALDARPELREADERVANERAGRVVSRSDFFPKVTAEAHYDRRRETLSALPETWEIVGTATWTLWDWGKTGSAVRASSRRIDASRQEASLLRDRIEKDVHEASLALAEAGENESAARAEMEYASENMRVTAERFDVGLATSTDILDAETLLTQARSGLAKTRFAILAAKSKYRRALGIEGKRNGAFGPSDKNLK